MTRTQEQAITLALNVLSVGFFECPRQCYEYFISDDECALLMAAAGLNAVGTPPQQLAVAALARAVAREGLFEGMTDFHPPRHFCSFLREQVRQGRRDVAVQACDEGQRTCPYATFERLKGLTAPPAAPPRRGATEIAAIRGSGEDRR